MSRETITKTKLQEVIFELYDVYYVNNKMSSEFAKELAKKLEEVEERTVEVQK